MTTDIQPGDTWAGVVRQPDCYDKVTATVIEVEKVCGPDALGCPDHFRGAHAHVVTMPGRLRSRTVALRRFRDPEGKTYTVKRIRDYGGGSSYYLVARPAPTEADES